MPSMIPPPLRVINQAIALESLLTRVLTVRVAFL